MLTIQEFDDSINSALNFSASYCTERYRSGHNEAVLKTVCPQGRMGSNPILSALFIHGPLTETIHIKITTPEDLAVANIFLSERGIN